MKRRILLPSLCILLLTAFLSAYQFMKVAAPPVVAMHLLNFENDESLLELEKQLPAYKAKGINLLFLEVDYHFDFKSHPELRSSKYITAAGAKRFSDACKANGIKVVPQFQSLGHQSWAENTWSLLTVYPELDLTPGAFPGNKGIYCREWDVTNPKVNQIVFPMIDEIVAAFQSDGIHIGMDEIFLLGSKESPNTFGKDPGELYAKVVNEFHAHFVIEKHLTLYMWGDRLIDAKKYDYGEWESSMNGTATALNLIPKDVVICDWHYGNRSEYPSIPMFLEHGFKVIPCSYTDPVAAKSLIKYSFGLGSPGVLGHCFTSWSSVPNDSLLLYPAFTEGLKVMNEKLFWDVTIKEKTLNEGSITVELQTKKTDATIHYTLDGSAPGPQSNTYKGSVSINSTGTIKAQAYMGTKPVGEVTSKFYEIHLATGKKVTITPAPDEKFKTILGNQTLVNSTTGSSNFKDGEWLGVEGQDVTITIDLGKSTKVNTVYFNTMNQADSWILPAGTFKVQLGNDGTNFQTPDKFKTKNTNDSFSVNHATTWGEATSVRYIRITIPKQMLPTGHPGAGNGAWLFVDEVVVK